MKITWVNKLEDKFAKKIEDGSTPTVGSYPSPRN